jgi:hypothetical protein
MGLVSNIRKYELIPEIVTVVKLAKSVKLIKLSQEHLNKVLDLVV